VESQSVNPVVCFSISSKLFDFCRGFYSQKAVEHRKRIPIGIISFITAERTPPSHSFGLSYFHSCSRLSALICTMFASSTRRTVASRLAKLPSVFAAKESRQTVTVMAGSVRQPQLAIHNNMLAEKGYGYGYACRFFSTTMPDDQLNKRLNTFQDLFVEARLCLEDVADAAETTYFDEDAETAKEAVAAAVDEFNSIINDIEDADQKNRVLRSNGLKVEQLKGELEMAIKGGH
jgi:hypothetical protein